MNIPEARANAADASLPTFVDDGNAFFNIRRMHANGGSNSTADGNAVLVDDAAAADLDVGGAGSEDGGTSDIEGPDASINASLSFSSLTSLSVVLCGVAIEVLMVDIVMQFFVLIEEVESCP